MIYVKKTTPPIVSIAILLGISLFGAAQATPPQRVSSTKAASIGQDKPTSEQGKDSLSLWLQQLDAAAASRGEYSAEEGSAWLKGNQSIAKILQDASVTFWNDPQKLLTLAQKGGELLLSQSDATLPLLRRVVEIKPTADAHRFLAENLKGCAVSGDKTEKQSADFLSEALAHARSAMRLKPNAENSYLVGDLLEDLNQYSESARYLKLALTTRKTTEESPSLAEIYRSLSRVQGFQKEFAAEQSTFDLLLGTGLANDFDWMRHGDVLKDAGHDAEAGDAYLAAATRFPRLFCQAAVRYWSVRPDAALSAARKCIEKNLGKANLAENVANSHWVIAEILQKRGVYSEALSHAKEGISLSPKNPFLHQAMAESLISVRRYDEAIVSAAEAIRVSDGKYGFMHFTLGGAYFEKGDYRDALQSFKKAAESDTRDDAAAYNVALCNQRLGYNIDAVNWYREVLRRDPNHKDRASILQIIESLSK